MVRKLKLEELGRLSQEEFRAAQKIPVVIVLDNIRSAMNVGSVFRSADAFAIQKIYLCGITAKPPHREILKTAIGATESIDWQYMNSTKDCISQLRESSYFLIGIEQTDQSKPLTELQLPKEQKTALIFGNEVEGLSSGILDHLDTFVEIAQFGTKHSLNVSVCAGIVLWHVNQILRK